MSEAQKYQKKKNLLIALFLVLLVVFVGIMCLIVVYSIKHPKEKFLSPEEIEIIQMQAINYESTTQISYTEVTTSNKFVVKENDLELELKLTEDKKVKIIREDKEEPIEIIQNNNNINSGIKLIYQTGKDSLILTETGKIYKIINNNVTDGKIKAAQILNNMKIKNIVRFPIVTESTYIINSQNELINIDTQKEYNGVIKTIKTASSTIYVYENNYFGLEEGKMFVDANNQGIKLKISFDNKIIAENEVIYQINNLDNSLSTSNLGSFSKVWYAKRDDGNYDITLKSSTGYNDFVSTYYYF